MPLIIVTPPTDPVLGLPEVRDHLNDPPASQDQNLKSMALAAEGHIDGRDGWLGRCLITQTWKQVEKDFPAGRLAIKLSPVQSVTSLKYLDTAEVEQTLVEGTDFLVIPGPHNTSYLVPVVGTVWPLTAPRDDAVRLTFVAGYGGPNDVPVVIKQALKLLIGHWFDNREAVALGTISKELEFTTNALLEPLRARY
jgi:uncharacterized phiE125 gp8 family phage protein